MFLTNITETSVLLNLAAVTVLISSTAVLCKKIVKLYNIEDEYIKINDEFFDKINEENRKKDLASINNSIESENNLNNASPSSVDDDVLSEITIKSKLIEPNLKELSLNVREELYSEPDMSCMYNKNIIQISEDDNLNLRNYSRIFKNIKDVCDKHYEWVCVRTDNDLFYLTEKINKSIKWNMPEHLSKEFNLFKSTNYDGLFQFIIKNDKSKNRISNLMFESYLNFINIEVYYHLNCVADIWFDAINF